MRTQVLAIAVASAVALGACTQAQQSSKNPMMHGIVTVTKVDPARRP